MSSDGEESEGGDVRTALARCLHWEASYAAADCSEARCFVTRDADVVGEWLVRRIAESPHSSAPAAQSATAPAKTTPAQRRRGLETQLQHELRLRGARAESLEEPKVPTDEPTEPLARLARLYTAIPRFTDDDLKETTRCQQLHASRPVAASAHLSTLHGVCAASGEVFVVFEYERFALLDVLKHNRHVLHDDDGGDAPAQGEELALTDLKKRFLVYQLHRVMQFLHQRGLACGGFTPSDILLTDTLWVRLGTLPIAGTSEWEWESGSSLSSSNNNSMDVARDHELLPPDENLQRERWQVHRPVSSFDSRSITERWCDGDVSNFEYLMVLNKAAGRRMVDGVFHPFLPWVTDFRARDAGWRDLTKSKFRLNKGDNQLDRTYENSSVPHHITESLSEITYYIYMARRTPMQVLRQVVRSNFQPKEYPSSMARMYDWTPDECIPEFYTEPSVFTSIRGDAMEDLKLPPWCVDAHDFIRSHRAVLEGDAVSQQLHHWIDLNFGASLSGERAIKHKNVPLKAQREARLGKSPGFVQIFQMPHPPRRVRCQDLDTNGLEPIASTLLQPEHIDAAAQTHRVHFSPSTYRPSEMKTDVEGMLSKALRIVNDSGEGMWGSAPTSSEPARVIQSRQSMTALSLTHQGPAETKSQSQSGRLKSKRKMKSRPRSHGSDPLVAPASNGKDEGMKSPTVSRLATVIPNFFHPDSSYSHSSGSSGGSGLVSSFKMGGDATPKATTPVAGSGPRAVSQFADGSNAESARIPAPLIHGVVGDPGMPLQARSTSGGSATSPSTTSHIFRELWQQLSKPDEVDADYVGESSSYHLLDYEYGDADFDRLDEMDLQLLGTGLPIEMPGSLFVVESAIDNDTEQHDERPIESSVSPETRAQLRRSAEAIIDPVYSLPHDSIKKAFPDCEALTEFELRQAADLFALGCIIAEVYTLSPLFSRRSIVEFMATRDTLDQETSSQQEYWDDNIVAKLYRLPGNVKNAVLALVHPNPRERLSMVRVLEGEEVFSILESFQRESGLKRGAVNPILDFAFSSAQYSLFPNEFALVYRFLSQYHRLSEWKERFDATRLFLPSLAQLPPLHFRVVLPVIAQFFQAASHTESIQVERVAAAVVFLLPSLGTQLGRLGLKQELLRDVLRCYESSDVSHLLKICLASPEVIKQVAQSFGTSVFIESFLPVIVDWTVSTHHSFDTSEAAMLVPAKHATDDVTARVILRTPLFASEASSIVATALGELSSSAILGPSLATKYVLPALLPHLGKMKSKWSKLTKPTILKRKQSSAYGQSVDDPNNGLLSGQNNDGIHVTFVSKASLYAPHYIADSILLVCRELGDYPVRTALLPHVFEVLPPLITLAEKIGSVRVEGVPDDLGREVYVALRILRHVVRNLGEAYVQSEFLDRKGTGLLDLLDSVEPPFLHPRTAAAITAAASSSKVTTDKAAKQSILRSLGFMKTENRCHLRAFTAVGLARTLVAVCQKIGPDATTSAAPLVQSINRFLARCGAVYSELEVSNFQWHLASEVVSEFCIPLRTLLGRDAFAKHFPVVHTSTVLQLLLLPIGGIDRNSHVAGRGGREAGGNQRSLPDDEAHTPRSTSGPLAALVDKERNYPEETLRLIDRCPPDLLHFAYRTTRLNSVKAPSFLHVPRSRLNPDIQDLNESIFRVQESRRRRQAVLSGALSLSSPVQRATSDSAWLRPLGKKPFSGKQAASDLLTSDAVVIGSFAPSPAASGSGRSGFLESWAFSGEILHAIKAHSSSVRCVSTDQDEEILLSGSKSGSCRAWRLASHPCHAQAAVHASSPILAVQSAMDGVHALALEASCVHVWDIRSSQVRVKLPFPDESAVSLALLRAIPLHHTSLLPSSSFGAGATLGGADFAVATTRKVACVDLRSGPRVVADWRVDVHEAAAISALATIFSPSSRSDAFIVAGTASGCVIAIDRRTGRHAAKWQALDGSRVIKLAQISPSQLLVVGAEREARVWNIARLEKPRAQLVVLGVPEAIRESQVTVQVFADMAVLYAACGSKLFAVRLPSETDAVESSKRSADTVPSARMEAWHLQEPASTLSTSAVKLTKSKISAQSVSVLPLRRVVLLGSDDGFLKCVV